MSQIKNGKIPRDEDWQCHCLHSRPWPHALCGSCNDTGRPEDSDSAEGQRPAMAAKLHPKAAAAIGRKPDGIKSFE